jgi:hypothetical protein
MRRKILSIGAGLMLAASFAAPSAASPVCAGPTSIWVCVDPYSGPTTGPCIYVVVPRCLPVTVPSPTVTCGGEAQIAPSCEYADLH